MPGGPFPATDFSKGQIASWAKTTNAAVFGIQTHAMSAGTGAELKKGLSEDQNTKENCGVSERKFILRSPAAGPSS